MHQAQWLTFISQWMILVTDEGSRKIIDNAVKEDDILNHNIASTYYLSELSCQLVPPEADAYAEYKQTSNASRRKGPKTLAWTPSISSRPNHTLSTHS